VRRGAHRQRIEAETGDPGLTPDRREIPVQRRSPARAGSQTALADLRPESCQSDRGVRLLRRDHGDFPRPYVFVIIELGTRRILHQNVTAQPTAEWTLQQFRGALPGDHPYRFVIHDRDSIFSKQLDKGVTDLGVRVLRTAVRAPMQNSVCERFGGTLRRECLDFLIPLNERHLKLTIKEWGLHYNRGRPHSSLGPGIPEPNQDSVPASDHRHKLPAGYRARCPHRFGQEVRLSRWRNSWPVG